MGSEIFQLLVAAPMSRLFCRRRSSAQMATPMRAAAAATQPTPMPIFVAVESEPSGGPCAGAVPAEVVVAAGAAATVDELLEDAVFVAEEVEDYIC